MDKFLLEVIGVQKKFGVTPLLKDISFTLGANEFLVITGNSGAGKTTLLRILAGLESFEGLVSLTIDGRQVDVAPHVAYVPQGDSLWTNLTVRENIALYRRLMLRETSAVTHNYVDALLHLFQIDGLQSRYPARLSAGECQRVALARALATDRLIILLDEITANLDQHNKLIVVDALRTARQKGTSFIAITHDLAIARSWQETYLTLSNGLLTCDGMAYGKTVADTNL